MPKQTDIQNSRFRQPDPSAQKRTDLPRSSGWVLQRAMANPGSLTAVDVTILQRTVGNRETTRLLSPILQPKLVLGAADDPYEREADRVAQQIGGTMPQSQGHAEQGRAGQGQSKPWISPLSRLQRTSTEFAVDAQRRHQTHTLGTSPHPESRNLIQSRRTFSIQRAAVEDEEVTDQAQYHHGLKGGEVAPGMAAQIQKAQGGGKLLDAQTQRSMGHSFGADFSGVHIHTDAEADRLSRSIQAKAFTTGQDVFFRQGAYEPGSRKGRELIAHELTHVVQQGSDTIRRKAGNWGSQRPLVRPGGIQHVQREVTIEEVEEEPVRQPEPPREVTQPATPLLLADAPWAEVEAREALERKERLQASDPRYQKKLEEIKPKAPAVGSLDKSRIDSMNLGLKENFQARDPRYQKKLEEIKPKAPETTSELPESRMQDLESAFAQDRANQYERSLQEEQRKRKEAELQAAKDEANRVTPMARQKFDLLETADKDDLKRDTDYKSKSSAVKGETPETLGYWQQKLQVANYILQWATQRLSRRSLLAMLKAEINTTKVPTQFKVTFEAQATREYEKAARLLLTAERNDVKPQMAVYRLALKGLAEAHQSVSTFEEKYGPKYGESGVRGLMSLVMETVSNPLFDPIEHLSGLNEQMKAVEQAIKSGGNSLAGRMAAAGKAESAFSAHSTTDQDTRGAVEEAAAIEKAQLAFTKIQSDIKGRDTGILNAESEELTNSVKVLSSFADRDKEKQAHDFKAKFEGAPYYLDTVTSKIIHAERHIMGVSGYKTTLELERDYKAEADKQYKASKELWYKYLGYTNGTGNARVTGSYGSWDGVAGHHTVFTGPYTDVINAKDKNASDPTAVDRTADALLNVLYPSAGTGGAHYSLEFADPKPHAYRGGPTIPGARYLADRTANNDTWINAKDHMETKQQAEEVRVKQLIQDAIDDHMKVVHRKDPARRKKRA